MYQLKKYENYEGIFQHFYSPFQHDIRWLYFDVYKWYIDMIVLGNIRNRNMYDTKKKHDMQMLYSMIMACHLIDFDTFIGIVLYPSWMKHLLLHHYRCYLSK